LRQIWRKISNSLAAGYEPVRGDFSFGHLTLQNLKSKADDECDRAKQSFSQPYGS
jgi:hypothetical protein